MCGFTGFWDTKIENKQEIIDKMGETIAHRGPDSSGSFVDSHVAFGFRRLSIIDLSGGSQPIHSADGRYVMVFNGEIYNYLELRAMLEKEHGAVFQTDSDTETVLQMYMVYGNETASKLRGMFAFVIYDKHEHTFYGARDCFGIKPLYYANMNGSFLFGSEIKTFLPHPSFVKQVNKDALKMYLIFQYTPLRETMFKGVFRLEPGTYFTYDGETFDTCRYYEFSYDIDELRSFDQTVGEIEKTVQESVDCHQMADPEVGVGSFLSAGVDSSYIASSVKPTKTYTVGFDVDGFDETVHAAELSKILNMPNVKKMISPDEFFGVLPAVQYHSDEPHANLSAVPLYFLSQLAAKEMKVVLSGEGADELFGGYEEYFPSQSGDLYQKIVPAGLRKSLGNWAKGKQKFKGQGFLMRNAGSVEDSYIGQAFIMDNEEADGLLSDKYKSELRYQDVTKPYYDKVKGQDTLHRKMYLDMHLWLPNDILLKADKMTMAHSLELRVPYLDRNIWELARTITSDQCVDKNLTKKAFRKAAFNKIPDEWAKRKKMGFMVPFRVWIRQEKYYRVIKEMFERDFVSEFFQRDVLLNWLEDHKQQKSNNQRKIYTAYSFLLWYEQYFVLR